MRIRKRIRERGILLISYASGRIFLFYQKNGKKFIGVMAQKALEPMCQYLEILSIASLIGKIIMIAI
jgi:hypothetical protein